MNINSRVARIVRAGEDFSRTNQKLREAVSDWIKWFANLTRGVYIPASLGWELTRTHQPGQIKLTFSFKGEDYDVYTDWDEQPMETIHLCCQALAGEEGERLTERLESLTEERGRYVKAFEAFRGALVA